MKKNYLARLFTFLLLLPLMGWGQQAGSLDTTFTAVNVSAYVPNPFYAIGEPAFVQPDGKVLLFNQNNLIRLNTNGSVDEGFQYNPPVSYNTVKTAVALLPSGKILVAARFDSGGAIATRVFRILSNGNYDNTFPTIGLIGEVHEILSLPDGKALITGLFYYEPSGVGIGAAILKINENGTRDLSFGSYGGFTISDIDFQPDGKFLIAGELVSYDNRNTGWVVRTNINGTIDTTFRSGANNWLGNVMVLPNGKILINGTGFTNYNNRPITNAIACLNSNGSLDTVFTNHLNTANGNIVAFTADELGRVYIGGAFTSYSSIGRNKIARLNPDGSLDLTFNPGTGFNGPVNYLVKTSDNKIIALGQFSSFNGVTRNNIVRIYGETNPCSSVSVPNISANGSTTFCLGGSTILTSSALNGNLWSTGDTTRSITVNTAGNYSVRVISGACTSAISNPVTVNVIIPSAPQIEFDSVGNRCLGSEIMVSVAGTYNQYRWNNGATTRSITVRGTGVFSAEVLDTSGCWSLPSRTANIAFDTAFCAIRISIVGIDSLEASVYADRYEWFLNGIQLLSGNNGRRIPIQGFGTYTVRSIFNGRTSPLSSQLTIMSSNKFTAAAKFEVFPNPATDRVTIKTTG
ncbi:MAG: delta-60 repeat domain-containing protein, partial [Flexibacteraceae bacterium]